MKRLKLEVNTNGVVESSDEKVKRLLKDRLSRIDFLDSPIDIKSFLEEQVENYTDKATLHKNANEYFSKHLCKIQKGEQLNVGRFKGDNGWYTLLIVNSPVSCCNSKWSKDKGFSSCGRTYYEAVIKKGNVHNIFSPDSESKKFGIYFISAFLSLK